MKTPIRWFLNLSLSVALMRPIGAVTSADLNDEEPFPDEDPIASIEDVERFSPGTPAESDLPGLRKTAQMLDVQNRQAPSSPITTSAPTELVSDDHAVAENN